MVFITYYVVLARTIKKENKQINATKHYNLFQSIS